MKVTVRFFATFKDLAGCNLLEVNLEDSSQVTALKSYLTENFPNLGSTFPSALVAINRRFGSDGEQLNGGDEVAFFPPVSGGVDYPTVLAVTDQPLDMDGLIEKISLPGTGAVCTFTGIVRADTERGEKQQTISLEYEAYLPMAEEKLVQVAAEIRVRWPDIQGIVIVQRTGLLLPGTPSVIISCSAAHRDTGVFEAARYGIDRLKEVVPIWKKERTAEGETWLEGTYHPMPGE